MRAAAVIAVRNFGKQLITLPNETEAVESAQRSLAVRPSREDAKLR